MSVIRRLRSIRPTVAFLVLAAMLGGGGFWALFSTFKFYDDEGYILLSLQNFSRGGALYGQVYSQYGPFFFLFTDALHRLAGFDFTHTTGRLITLVYWLGAAVFCALIVRRHARFGTPWALFAFTGTFAQLWQMVQEPIHPGGLIVFVLAFAAWAGAETLARGQVRLLATVIGGACAALSLTKINVGAFFLAAAGAWLLLHAAESRTRRAAEWMAAAGLGLLPWILMHRLLGQPWVFTFAWVAASAALAIVLSARPAREPWFPYSGWGWLVLGGAGLTTVVILLSAARGTEPHELLEGVVLAPLRHPDVYSFPVPWLPGTRAVAGMSLLLAITVWTGPWRGRPWFAPTVAGFRFALAGVAAAGWLQWLPADPLILTLSYGLPFTWLLVVPLRDDASSLGGARVRTWLGLLVALQSMHAYPVGGSQLGWATFLWVPLLALAAAEAATVLREAAAKFVTATICVVAFGLAGVFAHARWHVWRASEPLQLHGAETLRLSGSVAASLRAMTANAMVHSDTLFSLPGLYSFNLWTDRPTPTSANATLWFSLLSASQQTEIIERLRADPRAALLVEWKLLDILRAGGRVPSGPLHEYLKTNFAPVLTIGSHEFWVKRGRTIAPLASAELFQRAPGARGAEWRLDVCIATSPGRSIVSAEWIAYKGGNAVRSATVLSAANCQIEVTPLFSNGANATPSEAAERRPLPMAAPAFARVTFMTNEPLGALSQHAVLRLCDASGAQVAEAVFAR